MILEAKNISTSYGESRILFDVSFSIFERESVTLLGRNGAGKTTSLRTVMGLTPPQSGSIKFLGQEIAGKKTVHISRSGIGFVPEDRRIFFDLTVRENLEVAEKPSRDGRTEWTVEKAYDLFPKLKELDKRLGRYLSGGEQQMLTIARTLMGNPTLLLLDEPSEGLAPIVVKMLSEFLDQIRQQGLTILLSEQNMKFALELAKNDEVIKKHLAV